MSLLTEQEITEIVREAARGSATRRDGSTSQRIAIAVEKAVLAKIKAQGAIGYIHPLDVGRYLSITSEQVSDEQVPVVALFPEGD